jgi:broad specificity phosphatase PhoE
METLPPLVTLRLWLIRHGETMANVENRVSGQAESALTLRGQQQAIALRSTLLPMVFWRRYASDLQRTRETAHLLLLPLSDQELFVWEERLRELSKGVRQGYPKHFSEEQALQARIQQAQEQGREFQRNEVPVLETEEQAYQRFLSWMLEVARDAVMTQQRDDASSTSTSQPTTTYNNEKNHVYPILVVSHSALLRVVLTRFFSKLELMQQGAIYDEKKAHNENHRLVIPNTSLTIVDIQVYPAPTTTTSNNFCFSMSMSRNDDSKKQETSLITTTSTQPKTRQEEVENTTTLESSVYYWKPKLQQLTWTGHYEFLP